MPRPSGAGRERRPLVAVAVSAAAADLWVALGYPYGPIFLSVVVALFSAVAAGPHDLGHGQHHHQPADDQGELERARLPRAGIGIDQRGRDEAGEGGRRQRPGRAAPPRCHGAEQRHHHAEEDRSVGVAEGHPQVGRRCRDRHCHERPSLPAGERDGTRQEQADGEGVEGPAIGLVVGGTERTDELEEPDRRRQSDGAERPRRLAPCDRSAHHRHGRRGLPERRPSPGVAVSAPVGAAGAYDAAVITSVRALRPAPRPSGP